MNRPRAMTYAPELQRDVTVYQDTSSMVVEDIEFSFIYRAADLLLGLSIPPAYRRQVTELLELSQQDMDDPDLDLEDLISRLEDRSDRLFRMLDLAGFTVYLGDLAFAIYKEG